MDNTSFSNMSYKCCILDVMVASLAITFYALLFISVLKKLFETCIRWGQVFILDSLSKYKAADAREAENIVERVTPRLQHANCAVVLSAVKVALLYFLSVVLILNLIYVIFTVLIIIIIAFVDDPSTNGTHHQS